MESSVSIIIATATRVEGLRRLLKGISRLESCGRIDHEIIIANNAPDEMTAYAMERVVAEFSRHVDSRYSLVREPVPGKCRAQNLAINKARGSILAFLDDDVEVTPRWLKAIYEFFQKYPFDAMQGPILVPPGIENDPGFLRAYHCYRTIDFVQYGTEVKGIKTLTGANMAVRKEIFSRVGFFDEQLGPGRSGISEDVEFAQRIIRNGGRIGYEPKAAVYHEVDPRRLTEEFFRFRHEQQGRSRLVYKRNSIFSIIPNLMRSIWTFSWYFLVGNERRRYRAKGRYFHYRAMLREKVKWSAFSASTFPRAWRKGGAFLSPRNRAPGNQQ